MSTQKRKAADNARKEQTRMRLLKAGAEVFIQQGFHGPRISDIVNRAEVGQGTFYRHFSSKRELFETLFDGLLEQLMLQFQPMTENPPSSLDQYRQASIQALRRLSSIMIQEKDLMLLFLRHGPSVDAEFSSKMQKTLNSFVQLAKFYLDHAMELGFVKKSDSEVVSQALVGIGLRFVENWLDGTLNQGQLDSLVEKIVDFAFYGFAGSRGELP